MFTWLMALSGASWILTYILLIRRGFQDRTYGMPFLPLCLNVSWEFTFSFIWPHPPPHIYTNIIALSLDMVIMSQLLSFWQNEFSNMPRGRFYSIFLSALILSFSLVLGVSHILDDQIGFYIAFGQNLLMSVLFISMLSNRDGLRGQSIYIAILKLLGTASASLAFSLFDPDRGSTLMNLLYLMIFLFDLAYIIRMYLKGLEEKTDILKMY